LWLAPAAAELARVRLDDGTVMRGDVELTATEVQIRNVAGVVRCPRGRVEEIEWLEAAKTVESEYARRAFPLADDDLGGHLKLAEWLVEKQAFELAGKECERVLALDPQHRGARLLLERIEAEPGAVPRRPAAPEAATQPAGEGEEEGGGDEPAEEPFEGVPPPPPLSKLDITRLKLSELELEGTPERLSVRLRRLRDKRDVENLVRDQMGTAPDYDPDWARILERGQPHEKLPVILKATGLKYANRIEIRGDPGVFATYRRRVLPLVTKGCVRSGCHGGRPAHAFRFPIGSQSNDEFVYTSFAILDRIQTPSGPLIDRSLPEESALLRYLLPTEEGQEAHPPVEQGRVSPVLRGIRDHRYRALVEWISALRSPHPDYELEYEFPGWLEPLSTPGGEPPPPDTEPSAPAPEDMNAGDQ
jgi:hypothetical protein